MLRQPPDHLGSSPLDGDFPPNPYSDLPEGMTLLGRTITIKGELTAAEHLIIDGHFEGQLAIPDHGLAIGQARGGHGQCPRQNSHHTRHLQGYLHGSG